MNTLDTSLRAETAPRARRRPTTLRREIARWAPEDAQLWQAGGKRIAMRNLWVSIPNLLCGFAVWMYWGMVAKFIQRVHFGDPTLFDFRFLNGGESYSPDGYRALMFVLPAVAGLAGATMRIPHSFMIALCGGRNVKFMTTLMLLLPALGAGLALQDPDVSFLTLVVLAALSGVGGGAFASSMSNISAFFPKRMQGLALGLNAGLGNLGVSLMQFLLPWVVTFGLFGGEPYGFVEKGSTVSLWVHNAGLVWVPILGFFAVAAFLWMDNLPGQSPGSTLTGVGRFLWLSLLGFAGTAAAIALLLVPWGPVPELVKTVVVLVAAVATTLALMRYLTPGETKKKLVGQFGIFRNKHTWVMTWLYTMTFGSFIGYANAFPKLVDDVFGVVRVDAAGHALPQAIANANAPDGALYIWIGAAVGALIRPVGGWLADRYGGARVTQWATWAMVAATIAAGWCVAQASQSSTPETWFLPFLLIFVALFALTGIGNGSTFRMVPFIFDKDQAGPVLGWISAIGAYGAFLIPTIFADQIANGTPELALYGFAGYYATCLVLNGWFYARRNATVRC